MRSKNPTKTLNSTNQIRVVLKELRSLLPYDDEMYMTEENFPESTKIMKPRELLIRLQQCEEAGYIAKQPIIKNETLVQRGHDCEVALIKEIFITSKGDNFIDNPIEVFLNDNVGITGAVSIVISILAVIISIIF